MKFRFDLTRDELGEALLDARYVLIMCEMWFKTYEPFIGHVGTRMRPRAYSLKDDINDVLMAMEDLFDKGG